MRAAVSLHWIQHCPITELHVSCTDIDTSTLALPQTVEQLTLFRCSLDCDIQHLHLDQLPNLKVIDLHSNRLTGTIDPKDFYKYSSVDLSSNKLKIDFGIAARINLKSNPIV